MGIAVGAGAGVLLGMMLRNIAMGIAIGVALGVVLGAALDGASDDVIKRQLGYWARQGGPMPAPASRPTSGHDAVPRLGSLGSSSRG